MRRLLPLGAAVVVLLAVAGIASHGRPLSTGGRGSGPTATFFDYVATTLVLFAIVMLAIVVYSLFSQQIAGGPPKRGPWHLVSMLLSLAGAAAIAAILLHTGFLKRFQKAVGRHPVRQQGQQTPAQRATPRNVRNPNLRWDEIGIFVVLIAGTAVVLIARRKTKRTPRPWLLGRNEEVSIAIDESIDDLRNDPDLRRAIVAAYARMEHALGRAGLPRHPAEAPFEYIERTLLSLDTSSASVRRLTALFESAKFSQHEPELELRDEAINALLAVREELARPVEAAVPA
ncbi:MAG: hypothetical protein QOE43_894 [Gaiellaceae bacterium]|nr:hypothetical protein [Gaiellaceae bacterium]